MGCPPWPVAKRARLEVGLEDRFQDGMALSCATRLT
jgi:hypothetical protein